MKIWIHRYVHNLHGGSLVRVQWANGTLGFSDLHPWPEFGEQNLDFHLRSLRTGQLTSLAKNSLRFNQIDADLRAVGKSAFEGLVLPRAHKLVRDIRSLNPMLLVEWQKAGFTHLKIKMGDALPEETAVLTRLAKASSFKWRIDFNGKLSAGVFGEWWTALDPEFKIKVDFIEDPTSGEQVVVAGPWANDWYKQKSARIGIVKPARESVDDLPLYDRLIFTHSLDHPIAQACAVWTAARYFATHPNKVEVCGLSGVIEGPQMMAIPGTGFGYDEILRDMEWEQVL
jgi:O-succinylbenzoate synthase